MKSITEAAFVVSVHYNGRNGPARINLKWKGNHEISDFTLDSLGTVVDCETETENTGWAVVRSSQVLNDSIVAPLSQFGHRILPSSVSPGDVIPLRPEAKELVNGRKFVNPVIRSGQKQPYNRGLVREFGLADFNSEQGHA
jgi:hypothetical protein